jgi:hypothetical protein
LQGLHGEVMHGIDHCARRLRHRAAAALAAAVGVLLPTLLAAQTLPQSEPIPGVWHYGASLYGYLPSVSGTSSSPADSGGTPINVNLDKILDLEFTLMGSFDAHNGRWGVFTDVIYLNLGSSTQQSRDFTIGTIGLPVGTTANLDLDLKGLVWTLGGQYRVFSGPALTMDALAGARLLDVRTTTRWSISGSLGPIAPSGRTGSSENKNSELDGIVGVKGRMRLGSSGHWNLPFYLDIGAGDSDLTWQAAAGVSYAFKWGDLTAMWRYLAYDLKSGKNFEELKFSGPLFGATFRW